MLTSARGKQLSILKTLVDTVKQHPELKHLADSLSYNALYEDLRARDLKQKVRSIILQRYKYLLDDPSFSLDDFTTLVHASCMIQQDVEAEIQFIEDIIHSTILENGMEIQ